MFDDTNASEISTSETSLHRSGSESAATAVSASTLVNQLREVLKAAFGEHPKIYHRIGSWPSRVPTPPQTSSSVRGLAILSPTHQQLLYDAVRACAGTKTPFFEKVNERTWKECKFISVHISHHGTHLSTGYANNEQPVISTTVGADGNCTLIYLNTMFKPSAGRSYIAAASPSNVAGSSSNGVALNNSQPSEHDSSSLSPPPQTPRREKEEKKKVVEKNRVKDKGKQRQKSIKEEDVLDISSDEPAPKKKKKKVVVETTPTYVTSGSDDASDDDYEAPPNGTDLKRKAKTSPAVKSPIPRNVRTRGLAPSSKSTTTVPPLPRPIPRPAFNLARSQGLTSPAPAPALLARTRADMSPAESPSPSPSKPSLSRTLILELSKHSRPNPGRGTARITSPAVISGDATPRAREASREARPPTPVASGRDQMPAAPIAPIPVAAAPVIPAPVTRGPTASPANAGAEAPMMTHAAHTQGQYQHGYDYAGPHNTMMHHAPPPQGYWGQPAYYHLYPHGPQGYARPGYDGSAYPGPGYHPAPPTQHLAQHPAPSNVPYDLPSALPGQDYHPTHRNLPFQPPSGLSNARETSPYVVMDVNLQNHRGGAQ